MKTQTLTANYIKTISWVSDAIVDWAAGGNQYLMDGSTVQSGSYYAYGFDASINTTDGEYAFIYQKLGTKGLLLKNGKLLREINRAYYFAGSYEYPAAFVIVNNVTYLVHCPKEYRRLDFENVETGEIITDLPGRKLPDIFHSRLEVSPDGAILMTKGWHWHPLNVVYFYNIKDCLNDPFILDKDTSFLNIGNEVNTASFISSTKVLVGAGDEVFDEDDVIFPPGHIAIWDMLKKKLSIPVKVNGDFGNLFAINDELAWDTFNYPKIINIKTGEIIDKNEAINSGKQQSSIVGRNSLAQIVFNRETKQLAIAGKETIYILTP